MLETFIWNVNDKSFNEIKNTLSNYLFTYFFFFGFSIIFMRLIKPSNGHPICPNNKKFIKLYEIPIKGNKDHRTEEQYQCEDCIGCPFRNQCHQSKNNRIISINRTLTAYHKEVIDNFASPRGINLRCIRSSMSEGTFGVIKQDYNYRRISRVSLKTVNLELYLIIIGFNLAKYHNLKNRTNIEVC